MSKSKENADSINKSEENKNDYSDINLLKSFYICKNIFSLISETKKLNLIIYNKNLQNKFQINLENYKNKSTRYIIKDPNGNTKEYLKEIKRIVYEGGYSKGKRNGKGKEFDHFGDLTFEGEYLNGKRSGKGKEYNYKGKVLFEGEYLNGKRNGRGKEYNSEGILLFDGEYLNNGRWNGKGKEYDLPDKFLYEGDYSIGIGKFYDVLTKNLKFEVEYSGEKIIRRKRYFKNGNLEYDLESKNENILKGKEYYFKGGLKFDGEFSSKWRMFNGIGYNINGEKEFTIQNGCGTIKEYDCDGILTFEGEYLYGSKKGNGKEYISGRLIFEGEYKYGERYRGKEYDYSGRVIYKGFYKDGFRSEYPRMPELIGN